MTTQPRPHVDTFIVHFALTTQPQLPLMVSSCYLRIDHRASIDLASAHALSIGSRPTLYSLMKAGSCAQAPRYSADDDRHVRSNGERSACRTALSTTLFVHVLRRLRCSLRHGYHGSQSSPITTPRPRDVSTETDLPPLQRSWHCSIAYTALLM